MNSETDSRAKKMARRVVEYMESPEGRKALEETKRRSRRTYKKPFTI